MDGLVGYGSGEESENSSRSPAPGIMNKPQKPTDAAAPPEKSTAQLEAEWESFQKLIGGDGDSTTAGESTKPAEAKSSGDENSGEEGKCKKIRRDSSSSSKSSDKSGKSDRSGSESGSSDDTSDDDSEDEKKKKKAGVAEVKHGSKSPDAASRKRKSRSASSSSESETETEKKPAPSQSAGHSNGQSNTDSVSKERRPSQQSTSPKRERTKSRSQSADPRRKSRDHPRARSGERRRRRRVRRSRSRGRRSGSRERRMKRRSRSRDKGPRDKDEKSDRPRRRSRSHSPKRRRRPRSKSRSRERRRRPRSKSGSPHRTLHRRRRRRRRRKRRPSTRVSRSRSRSRSPSPVKKKRNEPLNYKEKLKQSLMQVQKQAAEGKLSLDQLAANSKDLISTREKPSNLPLGSDNPLVAMATGQLGQVTPQQALLQTMAAMHQKAQQLTGVAVPKYYNPASVNPLKYAEQVQKRKLLWGKTKKTEPKPDKPIDEGVKPVAAAKTQWDGTLFTQDQDGKQTAKFRKLMGMKSGEAAEATAAAATSSETTGQEDNTNLKKHQEMFSRLDQEYEFARMTTHTHRGIGLGFNSMQQHHYNAK